MPSIRNDRPICNAGREVRIRSRPASRAEDEQHEAQMHEVPQPHELRDRRRAHHGEARELGRDPEYLGQHHQGWPVPEPRLSRAIGGV